MAWLGLLGGLTVRIIRDPSLLPALALLAWRFRKREWYRRFPFLPYPDPTYLRWRMHTAYGDERSVPPARDVERYARWVKGA